MYLKDIKTLISNPLYKALEKEGIKELRPCQEKAIKKGLFKDKNLLVCTPTASGKTLIAEMILVETVIRNNFKRKGIYLAPLRALANEKFKEFKRKYDFLKIALSIGDLDSDDPFLDKFDIIITTPEKLDSLMRHHAFWIYKIKTLVVDEIHTLNDYERGPTLEIIITLLRELIRDLQIIGLSATIGNPDELGEWLNAEVIIDNWRPVKLEKGIYYNGKIEFFNL